MTREQKILLAQIIVCAVLFAVVEILTHCFDMPTWAQFILFALVWLVTGWRVVLEAAHNIRHGDVFDENFLMGIASIAAFALAQFPEAVEIMLFYAIGDLFESVAVGRSRRAVSEMLDLCPDKATVMRDGVAVEVDCRDVRVGETIVVKPGEKFPLDATIIMGETSIDTAALTGESLPVDATVGDEVYSGCVNLSGLVELVVTKPLEESTASKIMQLVEESSSAKARTEQFITRFARIYTPCVVIAAVLVAVVPPLFTGFNFADWIYRALMFLIISCPCALVISVPLSFFGGIGSCSRCGVLVKGSNYLEALAHVKTMVFDKTGTLTQGKFSVTAQKPVGVSAEKQLEYAALAESASSHPIAVSLVESYGKPIDGNRVKDIHEAAGHGVIATVDGVEVRVGRASLMEEIGLKPLETTHEGTSVHVAIDGQYAGYIGTNDTLKPDTKSALEKLRNCGVETMAMVTGDSEKAATAIAAQLDLNEIHAGCLPTDKVSLMQAYRQKLPKGGRLVYVGDGMNDAPVLAQSDVGIAMGGLGSDAAIEAADLVVLNDALSQVPRAVMIAKKTMAISRENIVFSLTIKAIILVLAAIGIAPIELAVFADVGVLVIAIINAMRALHIRKGV